MKKQTAKTPFPLLLNLLKKPLPTISFSVFSIALLAQDASARDIHAGMTQVYQYVFNIGKVITLLGVGLGYLGSLFSDNPDFAKRFMIRSGIACIGFFGAPTIVSLFERFFGGN